MSLLGVVGMVGIVDLISFVGLICVWSREFNMCGCFVLIVRYDMSRYALNKCLYEINPKSIQNRCNAGLEKYLFMKISLWKL